MLPWSQRRQRTTWRRHEAQVNRRAALPVATDEDWVDPARTRTILGIWDVPRMAQGSGAGRVYSHRSRCQGRETVVGVPHVGKHWIPVAYRDRQEAGHAGHMGRHRPDACGGRRGGRVRGAWRLVSRWRSWRVLAPFSLVVMAGFVPAIHSPDRARRLAMPGTSPGMTAGVAAPALPGEGTHPPRRKRWSASRCSRAPARRPACWGRRRRCAR